MNAEQRKGLFKVLGKLVLLFLTIGQRIAEGRRKKKEPADVADPFKDTTV